MPDWLADLQAQFQLNFIEKERWRSLLTGLGNTMKITILAALLGVAIGIVIAAIRSTYDNNKEDLKHKKSVGYYILGFFNGICKIYLTIIRGTPVVVQLLIIYFVIFASSTNDIMIATLAFGINSGAAASCRSTKASSKQVAPSVSTISRRCFTSSFRRY